ncbi:MAG TPA: RNA 2',3'-cyclic phosphodiesterase [Candidatus Binataceae bacterium]|nr:RNA 2',3'-cyclic phosphodiesterase [Candidatus Binataceae bacterium]
MAAQTMPDRIRAFIAVRMSDAAEAALADFIAELRSPDDGIKWVRRSNLHVTLKFLGPAVQLTAIEPLAGELRSIASATEPFEFRARGVGGFPDLARPRVIWAGLISDRLAPLAERVEQAAATCGFERESRPFSGHLTIGRVRSLRGYRATRARLEAARERDFGVSRVDSMTLYRSVLAPEGSIYEALATFVFRPAA